MPFDESVERARVSDTGDTSPTLFSADEMTRQSSTARDLCPRIDLNWYAASKLHEDGLLSFRPTPEAALTAGEEAELRFVGTLVAAGCDGPLMRRLLAGLRKPYRYRIEQLAYDWSASAWRFAEGPAQIMNRFDDWLDDLVATADRRRLDSIQRRVDDAIRRLRTESARMSPW